MIQRGYYVPLVLANGCDFLQLDMSGSMAFKDHIKGYMSYWYKKERPVGPDPLGIVKLGYQFVSEKGPVEIGHFSQHFDPCTEQLHTRVFMHQFEMEVTSFLTYDHTYIEIFKMVHVSDSNATLQLDVSFPCYSYTRKPIDAFSRLNGALTVGQECETALFRYSHRDRRGDFSGVGRSTVRVFHGNEKVLHQVENDECSEYDECSKQSIKTFLSPLQCGDLLVRITTVIDSRDSEDWQSPDFHQRYLEMSFDEIIGEHEKRQKQYSGLSSFKCSDENSSQQFNTSHYVCKASLHEGGSSVSCLAIPNGHGMGTYWDIWFVYEGLVRTNRTEEASRILDFFIRAYPEAKRVAKTHYGLDSARFEWVLQSDGSPFYHADQIHNNLVPVFILWTESQLHDRSHLLVEHFDLIKDAIRFVIQFALRKDEAGCWYLRELVCVDESVKRKRNELLTLIGTWKALEILIQTAREHHLSLEQDLVTAWDALQQILSHALVDGVYRSFENADVGTWANVLAHLHEVNPVRFAKAVEVALEGCRESHGLGIGHTSRMRCATFPWVEGIFAWSMARNGDPRAFEYLKMMERYVNAFGGMSEYIWDHGEPSRDWFVGAHGVYLAALVEACVVKRNNQLVLFPTGLKTVPWDELSFSNFRVEGGLLVEAHFKRGTPLEVKITNDSKSAKEFQLTLGGESAVFPCSIPPQQHWSGRI